MTEYSIGTLSGPSVPTTLSVLNVGPELVLNF